MPAVNLTATAVIRLKTITARIRQAEQRCGRAAGSVTLLAVSKTKPVAAIEEVAKAGQLRFGENYVQEALPKIDALRTFEPALEWHFIGPVQANKTRAVANHFAWVHSVDRSKIAERLSAQRPADQPALNICLQVNIDNEASKSGFSLTELAAVAQTIVRLPNLRLRGLMAIPAPRTEFADQREPYARLYQAQQELLAAGLDLDTLSMGMSDDLEAAIAEGSTLVRIGTAIFGPRST